MGVGRRRGAKYLKLGETAHFCNCLLPNLKEHVVGVTDDGCCVYCGYHAIKRKITEFDISGEKFWGEKLRKIKRESLELYIKKKIYKEEIQ
jgi:hypothetical protein